MLSDFNHKILDEASHRPWPMSGLPWIMTQTWHDLLFAHWPIDAAALRANVPARLELEQYDGSAWIGIVPFRMTNVAPRAVPALPGVSSFIELNVRTYVRVGAKPGVFFFSLDADNPLAVSVARTMFHLPYYRASMDIEERGGTFHYRSSRTEPPDAAFVGSYRPAGSVFHARSGSLEYFLTERYCLYTVDSDGRALRLEIHHPMWPLQPAEATIEANTMTQSLDITLPATRPLLHFSKRQDMVAWPMTRARD